MRPINPFMPQREMCREVGELGARAGGIAGGAAHIELSELPAIVRFQLAYNETMVQNLLAYAAQLQVLGVIAGVLDGPTDEYRDAIQQAAGSYFSDLLSRSQRTHWSDYLSLTDTAMTSVGLFYEGLGWMTSQIPTEATESVGQMWQNTGQTLRTTDPDKILVNLTTDIAKSIWDACVARWEEFWADFDSEGLLIAMARLKADADFLAAELAIDVALGIATGGAAAGIKIVATRVSRTASRVVIRAANVAGRAVPDSNVLHAINLPDVQIDRRIIDQVFDEDNLRTGSARDDLTARAEVDNPAVEKPSGSKAVEDVGSTPKTTDLGDGRTRHQRGTNEEIIQYDETTGRPMNSEGTIRQDFGSTPRNDGATGVGKLSNTAGDQGGHLGAHRFFGDTPDEGIAPQAGNLNMGAWRTMENEWADWTKMGYEVDFKIDVYPPGAVRPDRFISTYVVRDPQTGKLIYKGTGKFKNRPGQNFTRVTWREMQQSYARTE